MDRRCFLRLSGTLTLTGLTRNAWSAQRGDTQPAPLVYDETSYELLRRLIEPLRTGSITQTWIDEESLTAAAKHRLLDLRDASLYVMDALVSINEARARRLFVGDSGQRAFFEDRFGSDTVRRFLGQSAFRRAPWMESLSAQQPSPGPGQGRGQSTALTPPPPVPTTKGCQTYKAMPKVPRLAVIVPGTWAATETWWLPKSPFADYIDKITGGVLYKGSEPFTWSCANDGDDRRQAAACFFEWCQANPADNLAIVAHSHGGNVVMWATHLHRQLKIERLILLGTPMRTDFVPDLRAVQRLFNVYTWGDNVQVSGCYPFMRGEGRTLADSDKVINLPVTTPRSYLGVTPHSQLHTPDVWRDNGLEGLTT